MTDVIVRIILHVACFGVAFYALNALDLNRFMKQGRVMQAQLLYLTLSMALGYLIAQFLLNIAYKMYY